MTLWPTTAQASKQVGIRVRPQKATQHQQGQNRGPMGHYQAERDLQFLAADASWATANNTRKIQNPTGLVRTQKTAKILQKDLWDHSPSPRQQSKLSHLPSWGERFWNPNIYLKEIISNQKETDILLIGSFKVHISFSATPGLEDLEENSVSYREIKKLHFLCTIGLCE